VVRLWKSGIEGVTLGFVWEEREIWYGEVYEWDGLFGFILGVSICALCT